MIRSHPKNTTFLRLCAALLASLVFVLGQSAAIGGVTGAGGASWIEICGDAETNFETPQGDSQDGSCTHCQFCLVQNAASMGDIPPIYRYNGVTALGLITFNSYQDVSVHRAEQFWAANRGPPLQNEKNNPMPILSPEMIKSGMVALGAWSFPWV